VSVNIFVSNEFIIKLLIVLLLALAQDITISPENEFHLLYISIHSFDQSKKTSEIINSGAGSHDLVSTKSGQKSMSLSHQKLTLSKTCHDCHQSLEFPVFIGSFSQSTPQSKMGSKTCQLCQPLVIGSSKPLSSPIVSSSHSELLSSKSSHNQSLSSSGITSSGSVSPQTHSLDSTKSSTGVSGGVSSAKTEIGKDQNKIKTESKMDRNFFIFNSFRL
jgi:hypothetical protein